MARRRGWVFLLAALAGCRATPGRFAPYDPDAPTLPRPVVLASQVLADTAAEMVTRPGYSTRVLLAEQADWVRTSAAGVVGKKAFLRAGGRSLDPDALEAELHGRVGTELRPAEVRLFRTAEEALGALDEVIDGARRRLDVVMFLWDSDVVGDAVARRLAARAGPDLPVRVLVDGGGNLMFGLPDGASAREVNGVVSWLARQPHVEVIRTRDAFARFDHRKLVIADGAVAWTGGRNFTFESFFLHRDVTFTVAGPLAAEMADRFDRFWEEQGGKKGTGLVSLETSPVPFLNAQARLVFTEPGKPYLAAAVYAALDHARRHVYLENPYLMDSRAVSKLARARRRGVDVRVVLTVRADSSLANAANRLTANRLLRAGVRVYLFPSMTHVKALSVDGRWAYLGTGNFDPLSLHRNREIGLAVAAGPLLDEIEQRLFLPDLRPEWELREPLPVSLGDYAAEFLLSLCL